jgi:DNA-binding MarR family transcriptional regulator
VDPADRRRLLVALTPRGQDAADAVGMAVAQLDAALEAQIGATGVTQARAALTALTTLGTATSAPHPDEERDVDA